MPANPTKPLEAKTKSHAGRVTRRKALGVLGATGIVSPVFVRAVAALAHGKAQVTAEMIHQAEWISGLEFDPAERQMMVKGLNGEVEDFEKLRAVHLENGVYPAMLFNPHLPLTADSAESPAGDPPAESLAASPDRKAMQRGAAVRPKSAEELAFLPVYKLSELLRTRKVSSVELTKLYLERLHRYDSVLHCVITYTEELAMRQAEKADAEIRAGHYRGPLHGVPWGAKDLLSVPGYPTTWGAKPYENQVLPETAAVVRRLEEAGAVLVAKLTLGALAMGDIWFGGKTRNPWKPKQGSSGSSAGPASATAAGLVGFSVGSETLGSIVSPSTRCGCSGLRPTFGRVSRFGAMALAWSMDKLGPICRSVEDCALVFRAIQGADGLDPTAVGRPFPWPLGRDTRTLRVGYVEAAFNKDRTKFAKTEQAKAKAREWQQFDLRTLEKLRSMGFKLRPIALPSRYPVDHLEFILSVEAATAFDALTRSGRDKLLTEQGPEAWPNIFRQGQMIPGVEYLRANRIRTLVIEEMEELMREIDVYVCPSFVGPNLLLTNLTGNPAVVVPNGFRSSDGTPTSITFMGKLYGETQALAVARAYQEATGFNLKHPPLFSS